MDSLSHLLALLAPRCEVNLHCRFGGRWQAGHQQMRSGVVPWHVVLRGEGRLNVGGQTHHLRAGDVVLLPHGSPHLMESLVEWGQVLPVAHRFNGTVTEMRAGPAEGALEMLCGEFYFGPHVSWLFSEASTLIHLHTDAREDCPELDALLNILVRESLAQRPGGSAIVRSLGDTLLVLLLRMLLGEQQPPGGLLRLMSDERLMPAVLAVMDYTQLKSISDEEVRQAISAAGKSVPLYALVNKFDQKDRNSDDEEQVRAMISGTSYGC